jgi:outer membrane protein
MKKVIFLLCSLIMLGLLPVRAQKAWSLEECINYALENNLTIKQQELNVEYYKNNYNQSKFNTLPNLNASINQGYYDVSGQTIINNQLVDTKSKYWSGIASLNSSVTLFNGFQTINDILQKKYLFLQSQSDQKKNENDVSIELANGYLQVLFDKELFEVAKSKLEVTSLQVERTKKLLDVGNVAQGELFQIKAQEANDKTSVINAKNTLDISILSLTQLLDIDSTAGFDIVIPQNIEIGLLAPLDPVQDIYAKALENMPEIKSAEYNLKSSEKLLNKSWGYLSPDVSVSGSIYSNTSPSDSYLKQIEDKNNKSVSVTISIPIFNQLQVKNSISNAKLQVQNDQLKLKQAKMALYKEVQQAHADASAAREKYYSSVEAVNSNEEAFKYTSQKMEVGLVNSVDYNVAQNNLVSAKSSMLQAKYEYIFKLKILDLYMGKPITL